MEKKTDLNLAILIWVVIDLILLAGAFYAVSYYWTTAGTLNTPCGQCGKEVPTFKQCVENYQKQRIPIEQFNNKVNYTLNLEKIIKENNNLE